MAPKAQAMMLAPSTGKSPDRDRTLLGEEKPASNDGGDDDLEEGWEVNSQKADNGVSPPGEEENLLAERKMKRRKILCIGLVFSLVVGIAAGVLGYFLLNKDSIFKRASSKIVEMDVPTGSPSDAPTPAPTITNRPSESPSVSLAPSASFEPSSSPSDFPSPSPTFSPSAAPSPSPTLSPSGAPTDVPSSSPTVSSEPTISPSGAPTRDLLGMLQVYFSEDYGINVTSNPNALAIEWLAAESTQDLVFDGKLKQRFALVALDLSLQGAKFAGDAPRNAQQKANHCNWKGIVCNGDGFVEEIGWSYQPKGRNGSGTISPEVRLLVGSLKVLDLSNNGLVGTIPEQLYKLTNLEKLFLLKNRLEGTISSKVGNFDAITHFHLSHNKLTGSIPTEIKSGDDIRPLEYFNLYSNNLNGTLPQSLRWRSCKYFDVGRNQLTGTLPDDIGEKFVWLRHLHLDHNDFGGTLPSSYNTVGNGRLESFSINHNQLTGEIPGERDLYNKLVQYTLQSNQFERMANDNCKMEVPQGEMVEFRTDCDICRCNGYFDLCELQCLESVSEN